MYFAQTFQSQAAEQYLLDLLKRTSNPPYTTLYDSERKEYRFFVHAVPPHIPALFHNPPDRWLLDLGIVSRGTVVPQTMWYPRSSVDIRRHVEMAELQMPVFFEGKDGKSAFPLRHALMANAMFFFETRQATHYWVQRRPHTSWPGYKEFKRQIPLRDESRARNPITKAKFVDRVGRIVETFLQVCELDPKNVKDPRKLWLIGPGGIQRSDIISSVPFTFLREAGWC
ncbi:hypothetical protein EI94DRAFT_1697575 [Lactarius quietus]|nr:hypothetical protein EI94DRAFT_1697575 [Lactarius quietus]